MDDILKLILVLIVGLLVRTGLWNLGNRLMSIRGRYMGRREIPSWSETSVDGYRTGGGGFTVEEPGCVATVAGLLGVLSYCVAVLVALSLVLVALSAVLAVIGGLWPLLSTLAVGLGLIALALIVVGLLFSFLNDLFHPPPR